MPLVPHHIIEAVPSDYDRRIMAGVHAVTLDPGDLAVLRFHNPLIERTLRFDLLIRIESQLTAPPSDSRCL